jgi:hypothetical protein
LFLRDPAVSACGIAGVIPLDVPVAPPWIAKAGVAPM